MKISIILCALLALAACDSGQPSRPAASDPSPSRTATVGPMSDTGPMPSPMPSAGSPSSNSSPPSAATSPSNIPSKFTSPTPNPLDYANVFPSSLAGTEMSKSSPSPSSSLATVPKGTAKDPKTALVAGQPNTITTESMGVARIGMTFGELKKAAERGTTFEVTDGFAVDFNAIAVKKQGKVQFYIPYERNTKMGDEVPIHYLVTDNPNYKTEQGVSPGMTIRQAAQIYGAAKLRLNKEQESKEVVYFAQQPPSITFYGVLPGNQDFAGIYPDSNEPSALETDRYNEKAQISRIIVACRPEVCAVEH